MAKRKGRYFNEEEWQTVRAVFGSLVREFSDSKLNTFLGSLTIEDMKRLYDKLYYYEYCKAHNIEYEKMTIEDFESAYFEKENGIIYEE